MRALWCLLIAACTVPPIVEAPAEEDIATDDDGVPLPSAGTATLRAGTIVLPAWIAKTAIVELGAVVFPDAPPALVPGNIIVSGSGEGFIRRVVRIAHDGDALRVFTTPATLADAVVEATFHMSVAAPIAIAPHTDARNEHLTATIDGSLAITPAIDVDFVIADGALAAFDLRVGGTGTTELAGTVGFTEPTHWAWGDDNTPATTPLFRHAYALGPLPIVVAGHLTPTLLASAFVEKPVTFTTGARATLAIDARAHYRPGSGWTTEDATTIALAQIGPIHDGDGHASLALTLDPKIALAFWGAGPELHLIAQAGGLGTYCGPSLFTALQAAMQGSVRFDLATLATTETMQVTLWDERPFLDELETCAD